MVKNYLINLINVLKKYVYLQALVQKSTIHFANSKINDLKFEAIKKRGGARSFSKGKRPAVKPICRRKFVASPHTPHLALKSRQMILRLAPPHKPLWWEYKRVAIQLFPMALSTGDSDKNSVTYHRSRNHENIGYL